MAWRSRRARRTGRRHSRLGGDGYQTGEASYVTLTPAAGAGAVVPLIGSGETAFGTVFEGIPDGIGVVPGPGKNNKQGYVDLYVAHEQSHVPFGGFADFQDSSVSRVRLDIASKSITDLEVALSPDAGFIRFCSAFMAGPEHGFPHYTFLVNEESNDELPVPAGAPYGADASLTPNRQAGYSVFLDTVTGKTGVLAGQGRLNHENNVIVPGGWGGIIGLSGDDTFTSPVDARATEPEPAVHVGQQELEALPEGREHAVGVPGDRHRRPGDRSADPFNNANDYLEIAPGDTWSGEFIPRPGGRGTRHDGPEAAGRARGLVERQ